MRKRFKRYDGQPRLIAGSYRPNMSLKPGSTVFVCSTIELFDLDIPEEMRRKVIDLTREGQYQKVRWLFLTKHPQVMRDCKFPLKAWLGTTVTSEQEQWRLIDLYASKDKPITKTFLSVEPLLSNAKVAGIESMLKEVPTDWLIIGSLNLNGRPVPADKGGTRIEWVWPILERADKLGIPVFLKKELLRLYPELPFRQEVPWVKRED